MRRPSSARCRRYHLIATATMVAMACTAGQLNAAEPPPLRGLVLRPDGEEARDVSVRVFELGRGGEVRLWAEPPVGKDGRFRSPLPASGGLVEVAADGFGRSLRWIPAKGSADEIELLLWALEKAAPQISPSSARSRITGKAVDGQGRPLPGARVRVMRLDFADMVAFPIEFEVPEGGRTVETLAGAKGEFEIVLHRRIELPVSDRAAFEVVCDAAGHASVAVPVQKLERQEVLCRLGSNPRRIAGRLRAVEGGPGVPLPVHLLVPTPGAPLARTVLAAADGRFSSAESIPRAEGYLAILNVPEYQPLVHLISLGEEGGVEMWPRPGVGLRIELRDEVTGEKVTRAAVAAVVPIAPLALRRQASTSEGRFFLPNLPPESEVEVRVEAAGYLHERTVLQTPTTGRADDQPGEGSVTLELVPGAWVSARVSDSSGRPVAGARVALVLEGEGRRALRSGTADVEGSGDTDASGHVILEGLARGGSYRVACTAAGFSPWWQEGVEARGEGTELEITLRRGARVEGYVLHEDGKPVEEALVQALLVEQNPEDPRHFMTIPEAQSEALTDAEGRYELDHLAAGTYLITADLGSQELIGSFLVSEPPPPLPLFDGDQLRDLSFYLRVPGRLRLVLDPQQEDVENIPGLGLTLVQRAEGTPFLGEQKTVNASRDEAAGAFYLQGIAPGLYDIEVRAPGLVPARFEEVEIESGGESVLELDLLASGRRLRLAVHDSEGRPLSGIETVLYRLTPNDRRLGWNGKLRELPADNPSLVSAFTDESGEVGFQGLEGGDYQLHCFDEEGRYYYETFELSGKGLDGDIVKTVRLDSGLEVPFRVETTGGLPLPSAQLVVTRLVPGFLGIRREVLTDEAGEALLDHLVPGPYQVEAFVTRAAREGLTRTDRQSLTLEIGDGSQRVVRVP